MFFSKLPPMTWRAEGEDLADTVCVVGSVMPFPIVNGDDAVDFGGKAGLSWTSPAVFSLTERKSSHQPREVTTSRFFHARRILPSLKIAALVSIFGV